MLPALAAGVDLGSRNCRCTAVSHNGEEYLQGSNRGNGGGGGGPIGSEGEGVRRSNPKPKLYARGDDGGFAVLSGGT